MVTPNEETAKHTNTTQNTQKDIPEHTQTKYKNKQKA
jgi:hypothetical protein